MGIKGVIILVRIIHFYFPDRENIVIVGKNRCYFNEPSRFEVARVRKRGF